MSAVTDSFLKPTATDAPISSCFNFKLVQRSSHNLIEPKLSLICSSEFNVPALIMVGSTLTYHSPVPNHELSIGATYARLSTDKSYSDKPGSPDFEYCLTPNSKRLFWVTLLSLRTD